MVSQVAALEDQIRLGGRALKPWGTTGEKTFSLERPMWDRVERLGGSIYAIAMDEPLCCASQGDPQAG